MQRLFYSYHAELWDAHQWLIHHLNPGSINYAQPKILETLRKEFDPLSLVLLQYTYFDDAHPIENIGYVDKLMADYNLEVIVEAMFCDGLPSTTPRSIAKKFRGQIICPTHPHAHKTSLTDDMVQKIRTSHEQWSNR
jgi:hypothetical protein